MSAAHCFEGVKEGVVLLGMINIAEAKTRIKITRSNIKIHEGYYGNDTFSSNDIAIVVLPEEIELNSHVDIIHLPDPKNSFVGEMTIMAGWGKVTPSNLN